MPQFRDKKLESVAKNNIPNYRKAKNEVKSEKKSCGCKNGKKKCKCNGSSGNFL